MKRVLAAFLAAAAAGCISVGGGTEPVLRRSWDLLPPPPLPVPPEAEGPETLWVEPFSVDPALDRDEIVWRRGGGESGAYADHRWARPPEEAVRSGLADALARSGAFAFVATDPRAPKADYLLRGHLARCEEEDGGAAWSGTLEVRVVLVRARDGEEILRRTYARVEKAPERNPAGVVKALTRALASAGIALAEDVGDAVARERLEPGSR